MAKFFWHILRHSVCHYMSLYVILSGIYSDIWHILTVFLAVYLISILVSILIYFASRSIALTFPSASGRGPAVPTEIWRPFVSSSSWDLELGAWGSAHGQNSAGSTDFGTRSWDPRLPEEEKDSINVGKDKDEEEAAVIKSRGPHLAQGELMPSNKLAISGGSGLV